MRSWRVVQGIAKFKYNARPDRTLKKKTEELSEIIMLTKH